MKYILTILSLTFATMHIATALGAGKSCPQTTPEENKALVFEFYSKVINETNFDNLEQYMLDSYIQHNPWFSDGQDGLRTSLKPLLEGGGTKGSVQIVRSVADGNFVWLHSKAILNGKPQALVDIFRIECGRAAEHWDVIMEIVPSQVNDHAYF